MKKLRLDLDHLAVESFDTSARRATGRGTVRGHTALTGYLTCQGATCVGSCLGEPSCIGGATCNHACPSGGGTCGGLCTYYNCGPATYEFESCGCPTGACGQPTDNTGCGQATCGNGTCAVNTCPADTV